ncbi:hypothetical protein HDU76_011747 [Blyttiomyces sp. JEL0837]|nr:hypothetical protein HDU76_011747 [Blyttiomyces sp. JEL0837]
MPSSTGSSTFGRKTSPGSGSGSSPLLAGAELTQQQKKGHACPIRGCTATFARKFNMVQHFRSHARRMGVEPCRVEKDVEAIKGTSHVKGTTATVDLGY